MAKWLDKYKQGGMVLNKKTKDNYGNTSNANDGYSTAGPGWVGEGTTDRGFDYNGAWGGTMEMGGSMPGSVGFMYARTQNPAPANGKYAKKTLASAQDGKVLSGSDPAKKKIYGAPEEDKINDWFKQYYGSDFFKQNLTDASKGIINIDPNEISKNAINAIDNTEVIYPKTDESMTYSFPSGGKQYIVMGNPNVYGNQPRNETYAHEVGHTAGLDLLANQPKNLFFMDNHAIGKKEYADQLYKDLLAPIENRYPDGPKFKSDDEKRKSVLRHYAQEEEDLGMREHGKAQTEQRADIMALRYLAAKKGIWDASKSKPGSFTADMLNKLYKTKELNTPVTRQSTMGFGTRTDEIDPQDIKQGNLKNVAPPKSPGVILPELRRKFSDKDILYLMNKLAKNEGEVSMDQAQNGKEMKFWQGGLDFTPKSISQQGGRYDNLFDVNVRAAQDATRNVIPRKMTAAEKKEAKAAGDAARKRSAEKTKAIVDERKANMQTKGDLNTSGSWHVEDKSRWFPESVGGIGEMIDDYVNPFTAIGGLTDLLGESIAARDPRMIATSLGLTAGLGALGFDPLGSVLKGKRTIDNTFKGIRNHLGKLGELQEYREAEQLALPYAQQRALGYPQQPQALPYRQAMSLPNAERVAYQPPTDAELYAMNLAESTRYAPRVSRVGRQRMATPDDMDALARPENVRQIPVPRVPSQYSLDETSWWDDTERNIARGRNIEDIWEERVASEIGRPQPVDPDSFDWTVPTPPSRTTGRPRSHSDQMIDIMNAERNVPRQRSFRNWEEVDNATDIVSEEYRRMMEGPSTWDDYLADNQTTRQASTPAPQSQEVNWAYKDSKIGEAPAGSNSFTDETGNTFSQNVYHAGDDVSGTYKVTGPDGGFMKMETRGSKSKPGYVHIKDMTFRSEDEKIAAKQFGKLMAHLPPKVDINEINTSMYSQPLMNQQVARWANNQPGRIELEDIRTGYLNNWHKEDPDAVFNEKTGEKYGDYFEQLMRQFPRLKKTTKTISEATGQELPEPVLKYYDVTREHDRWVPIDYDELKTPEWQERLKNNPSMKEEFIIESPKYKIKKNWKNGGIVDSMGQWAHPGEITTIPGNDITMKGVDYDVVGISNTGDKKLMKPGKNYKFDGDYVTEYPKGGWLNKYK